MNENYSLFFSPIPLNKLRFPKTVIFDWDNTLTNGWLPLLEALNKTIVSIGMSELSFEGLRSLPDLPQEKLLSHLLGNQVSDEIIDAYWENFSECYFKNKILSEGTNEILKFLYDAGVNIVIFSNLKECFLKQMIKDCGVDHYIDKIIGLTSLEDAKPSPSKILKILKKSPTHPSWFIDIDVWFIGDSLVDLETARRAGILPVWVRRHSILSGLKYLQSRGYPILECEGLTEVKDLLSCLSNRKSDKSNIKWLNWGRQLKSIAQNGITFSKDHFDSERYHQVRRIASEIFDHHTTLEYYQLLFDSQSQSGYDTPKIDLRAIILDNKKIFLVKERKEQLWSVPGGWADIDESPSEAIVREVREEGGMLVKPVRLLAFYDKNSKRHQHPPQLPHAYKAFFLCDILEINEIPQNYEIDDAGFFDIDSLPNLCMNRVTPRQIKRLILLAHSPICMTDFD